MTYPVAQLLTSSSFHPVRTDLAENAIKAALQGFTITTVDAAQIREFIAELRTPPKDTMTKVAADLLTPDEITAMMKACTRTMDRALIMMLYEGGFRIGEIGTMTWGDPTFDKYGIYRERELQDQHAPVRPAHHGPGIPGTVTGLLQAGPERRTASLCERTRQAPYSCDH